MSHTQQYFNSLMKWFFLELQESIAQMKELKTAKENEMVENGMDSLDYGAIITAFRTQV